MAAGWLNHRGLMIVKGIGKTPGDTLSNEINPVTVNLLSGVVTLNSAGWSPSIPAVKNAGVWSDSPVSDGRRLLAAPVGNVTEKMTVIITDSTYLGVMRALSNLNHLVSDCRDFWQSQHQIDPVYLMWYASCGAGPQYALLYNIELATEYLDADQPTMTVNMTLEREPFWRALPPGANPKIWTTENFFDLPYNTAKANLVTGTDHVGYLAAMRNDLEWASETALRGLANYIDIPASSIPGDAPALALISIESVTPGNFNNYYVALDTKPTTMIDSGTGVSYMRGLNFNAADGELGGAPSDTTVVADANGVRDRTNVVARTTTTFVITPTETSRITWVGNTGSSNPIGINLTRGRYAAFLRCRQNAVTFGDIKMRLSYGTAASAFVTTPEVSPTVQAGSAGWPMTYMGIIDVPTFDRSAPSGSGLGLDFIDTAKELLISLQARRTAGASHLYVADLVLLPIDEGIAQLINNQNTSSPVVMDNTGYFGHGDIRDIVLMTSGAGISEDAELRGQALTLEPGVNNRIHILGYDGVTNTSLTQSTMNVRVDIVPRCSGIRTD